MDSKEKTYVFLCTIFSVLITTGNLIYQKFVSLPIFSLYSFELSVGAIIYPFTFLITDVIAEFYGKEKARFCVTLAVAMNILVAVVVAMACMLEATSWSKVSNQQFSHIFGLFNLAFISSIIANYTAQSLDVFIYLWIRKFTNGRYLLLRSNLSTAISLFIDTSIVIILLSLFGIFPKEQVTSLILNSYSYKLFFTICSSPVFYLIVKGIRYINTQEC